MLTTVIIAQRFELNYIIILLLVQQIEFYILKRECSTTCRYFLLVKKIFILISLFQNKFDE